MKRNLRTMAISLALLVSSSIISSEEAIKCDTEDQVTHEMCSFMFSDEMYSVKVLASLIDGRMKSTLMSSEMIKFINDAGKARNAGMSAPIYPPPQKNGFTEGLYTGVSHYYHEHNTSMVMMMILVRMSSLVFYQKSRQRYSIRWLSSITLK